MLSTGTKRSLLSKHESILPVLLFLLFYSITIPGIAWGAPAAWNPDELVTRVDLALHGDFSFFDTTEFSYPSLPKYVMYGIGKIVYSLGYSGTEFIIASRLMSVMLGGLIVMMVYFLTRKLGGNILVSLFAALLTLSSSVLANNARFAHNDIYLTFFALLTIVFLLRYRTMAGKIWLYLTFLGVGWSASCKYNGIILLLLPLGMFIWVNGKTIKHSLLPALETLFIGFALTCLGYAMGTPKALLWMAYYFKRMLPSFFDQVNWGRIPGAQVGLFGQWATFRAVVGDMVFILFIAAFLWFLTKVAWRIAIKKEIEPSIHPQIVLMAAIFIYDMPFWASYNYQMRYFLPMLPLFSILTGLFIQELVSRFRGRYSNAIRWVCAVAGTTIVIYSLLRVVSVMLLFVNDSRIAAGEFIATLLAGTSIEYTLYPPQINKAQFSRAQDYPIYITKFIGYETAPADRVFNEGEAGLLRRQTDYLVVDSFTYGRFSDEWLCENNAVECEFFSRLLAGETSYRLVRAFNYTLPPYLPQVSVSFANPDIRVYERTK